eukprot:gene11462-13323_t
MTAKQNKFTEVDETIVAAALAGSAGFPSSSRVELRFLDSIELCRLLKHDHVLTLGDFILENKLTGSHLEDGVETIDDLMELGLNKVTARLLMKRIIKWKEKGLPEDFHLTESLDSTPAHTTNEPAVKRVRIENAQDATLLSELSQENVLSAAVSQEIALATEMPQCDVIAVDAAQDDVDFGGDMTEDVSQDHNNAEEKQLDDDFIAARWCWCRAATDRILAAAEAGNHLAEAYLSILYNNIDTLLGLDQAQANIFVAKSQPWLQESADNGNMFAIFNL